MQTIVAYAPKSDSRRYPPRDNSMFPPWRKLKETEKHILDLIAREQEIPVNSWEQLRSLFEQCRTAEDASEAICYHGVSALIAAEDGDTKTAIKHRKIEIEKINWLQEEEKRNPTDGYQIQNYGNEDLALRMDVLSQLQNANGG